MNDTPLNLYTELIKAVRDYALQEHPEGGAVVASQANFQHFKSQAQLSKPVVVAKPHVSPAHSLTSKPSQVNTIATKSAPTNPERQLLPPSASDKLIDTKPAYLQTPIISKETHKDTERLLAIEPTQSEVPMQAGLKLPSLEPLLDVKQTDFVELKRLWGEKFPQYALIEPPTKDTMAAQKRPRSQNVTSIPPVVLLTFSVTPQEYEFLSQVAIAISHYLAPAVVLDAVKLETELGWDKFLSSSSLRLIIVSHHALQGSKSALFHYREDTQRGQHHLGRIPLIFLSDHNHYRQEPKLKKALWAMLCQAIPKLAK